MKKEFRVIQGCPVFQDIAPYIAIITTDARATVGSIYRGDDARSILNAHGKHSQYQIYYANAQQRAAWGILGQPNPPGQSTHELRSDGRAYPHYRVGARLPWWCQGFDVNNADVDRVIQQAASHKWHLFRPYGLGAEFHHLCFAHQPLPTPHTFLRIQRFRATLPHH